MRGYKYLSLMVFLAACTTTQVDRGGFQDGTFTAATYDQQLDEKDTTLRTLDEVPSESSLQRFIRKDFYLPAAQLKGLRKRADQARLRLSTQSAADPEALRVLATEAIVDGRPELVQGFISYSKGKKARRNLMPEDQLLLGISAFLNGDHSDARRLLAEASGSSTVGSVARANLGLIAMRQGAHLEALDLFQQAESLEPKNIKLMHLVAEAAHSARRHTLSVDVYRKIIARDPNDLLARYNLGLVYHYGLRKFPEARREFQVVMDHPRAPRDLRVLADGAFTNVRREEEGMQGIATTGFQ